MLNDKERKKEFVDLLSNGKLFTKDADDNMSSSFDNNIQFRRVRDNFIKRYNDSLSQEILPFDANKKLLDLFITIYYLAKFNPKLAICKYFDELVRLVNIFVESVLENTLLMKFFRASNILYFTR